MSTLSSWWKDKGASSSTVSLQGESAECEPEQLTSFDEVLTSIQLAPGRYLVTASITCSIVCSAPPRFAAGVIGELKNGVCIVSPIELLHLQDSTFEHHGSTSTTSVVEVGEGGELVFIQAKKAGTQTTSVTASAKLIAIKIG